MVHGRMRPEDKDYEMERFISGKTNILVSTTVIEVGVDVPNATVMVIEQAERFGLAQLHQLRGRVGRGREQSFCALLHGRLVSDLARARLHALEQSNDGFVIADRDLDIRGPGAFFGTRQSGMPLFRVGNIIRDQALMERAKRHAGEWLTSGELSAAEGSVLREKWESRFAHIGTG